MKRDKISLFRLKRLINNKEAFFTDYDLQENDIKLIEEAILSGVTLPPVYVEEDKFGVLYFDDNFTSVYLRLLEKENISLRNLNRIEDYEFNIVILKPNENEKIDLFKKLKKKFNFFL